MNKIYFIAVLIFFCSCGQHKEKTTTETKQKPQLPAGAMPVKYIKNHLYIAAYADSTAGVFVFDTGADRINFDSVFFARHDVSYPNVTTAMVGGVGGSFQKCKFIMDTVTLNFENHVYKTNKIPIIQLKPILGDYGDGIIGRDFFDDKILNINYEHAYFNILDSISEEIEKSYSKIKFEDQYGRIFVPLTITLKDSLVISGKYILDLGSGGSLSLTSAVANRYNLSKRITNKIKGTNQYGGIGGKSARYIFKSNKIKIGGFTLNNMYMDYSTDKKGALASTRHFGLLGNEILERFNLIIDFTNKYLYIKPNSDFNKPDFVSRLGFKYVDRSHSLKCWNVNGFYENSPAQKSGLMVDDKITHVNGVSVLEIDYKQQDTMFRTLDRINLTVKRKEQIHEIEFLLKEML